MFAYTARINPPRGWIFYLSFGFFSWVIGIFNLNFNFLTRFFEKILMCFDIYVKKNYLKIFVLKMAFKGLSWSFCLLKIQFFLSLLGVEFFVEFLAWVLVFLGNRWYKKSLAIVSIKIISSSTFDYPNIAIYGTFILSWWPDYLVSQ